MIVTGIIDITWGNATENWDTFYSNDIYAQYILEEFDIFVPPPYGILWDHAVIVTIQLDEGGKPGDDEFLHKKKKRKIKVIFMMENKEEIFEKEKKTVKVEFKHYVENVLTEKFGQKVILEDVQIIHR